MTKCLECGKNLFEGYSHEWFEAKVMARTTTPDGTSHIYTKFAEVLCSSKCFATRVMRNLGA